MTTKDNLLLFFDRPTEPCFMQKGNDKAVFQLPDHYYPNRYKDVTKFLSNRFLKDAGRTIPVRNIALPDLSLPMELLYNDNFSLFVPKHRQMASKLIDVFLGMSDLDDLISVCCYCQMRINPYMFNYCLSIALLHREDTKGIQIPAFALSFPDKFMDPKVFLKAREVSNTIPKENRIPITIPVNNTASDLEPEQRVAYFREDIGVNLHHWHWHLVYPYTATDIAAVDKDRRGELFYYMHQQMVARYNTDRLCNNLSIVTRYDNFRAPIPEAYFPKLDSQVASRAWPPRVANTTIGDLDRPADNIKIDVSQLETWRERFVKAVESGQILLPNNTQIPLDEKTGIDVLGNMMESSIISKNRAYYGDLHNQGHNFISLPHDPDHRHLEKFGVMGDPATAMRDPVFYRWHAYIDDIFAVYKRKLTPYPAERLDFPGIHVSSISIAGAAPNIFNTVRTQWEQTLVELDHGLDFTPRGSILVRYTHLTHDDYTYVIEVNNTSGSSAEGMFRIFMSPALDEKGSPMPFDEQRRLMIELDKFHEPLYAGNNTIRRNSLDSSVTIPYENTLTGDPGSPDFCGCGWPHHMLTPKGTEQGYPVVLFVMVSNYDEDKINQDTVGDCNDASSYCGLRDRLYPDLQPMGYPFDRRGRSGVNNLTDFLTPNMAVSNCTINFTDATRQRT